MNSRMCSRLGWNIGLLAACVAGTLFLPAVATAGDALAAAQAVLESHRPIDLDARPSVTRYEAAFVNPRRAIVDAAGNLLVADWGAGAVFRIDAEGTQTLVAGGLDEPAGLALDEMGNLFVAQHAGGMPKAGSVVKIAADGMHSVHASGLGGPTDLAFGPDGGLYVASFTENSVVRVSAGGMVEPFAADIPGAAALAFDPRGTLYVASSTGDSIYAVSTMGNAAVLARGLSVPSDLAFDSRGHLIVANYGGNELSYVDEGGNVRPFAVVPQGTIAHAFDRDDNLVLANWDQRYLMKVVTSVTIPCPHCGKQVPVRFRPKPASPSRKPPEEVPAI